MTNFTLDNYIQKELIRRLLYIVMVKYFVGKLCLLMYCYRINFPYTRV